MALEKTIQKDSLLIKIFDTAQAAGQHAAREGAAVLRKLLNEKDMVNLIFAAAPSQNHTLAALAKEPNIDWSRVRAFHMDEYIGFGREKEQSFGYYLDKHLFSLVPIGEIHYVDGAANDPEAECKRYESLLSAYPPDMVFLGIGENAHIAFNDPWVADFQDKKLVKVVPLDETCRTQQVHDGCFPTLGDVPTHALTLTVPALFQAAHLFCTVPGPTKAEAVRHTITAEISEAYPSTIMRRHKHATMYCDRESGRFLLG